MILKMFIYSILISLYPTLRQPLFLFRLVCFQFWVDLFKSRNQSGQSNIFSKAVKKFIDLSLLKKVYFWGCDVEIINQT